MAFNDYGRTPNVWRPSEVPSPNTGEDLGVGPQPFPGTTETTTTTTEEGFFPGWQFIDDFYTPGTGSPTQIKLGNFKVPTQYSQFMLLLWFRIFGGNGSGSAQALFQLKYAGTTTTITGEFGSEVVSLLPVEHPVVCAIHFSLYTYANGLYPISVDGRVLRTDSTIATTGAVAPTTLPGALWNGGGSGTSEQLAGVFDIDIWARTTSSGTIFSGPFIMGQVAPQGSAYPTASPTDRKPRFIILAN